jgi:amino acid transporter
MMVYLDKGLGRWSAYAFGWAMMVVLVPSSVGYFAQVAAQYFVPLHGGFAHRWAKSGLVLVVLAFNLRGVLVGARFQDSLTVLKIAGVLAVAALGCVSFFAGGMPITATHHPSVPWSLSRFGVALVAVLWAYDGWIDVTSVAGEVRSPRKSVPFALMAGTLAVAALYLALNAGLIAAFGHYELSVATTPALDVGRSLGGRRLALAVGVLVGVAALGACAVGFMSGVRVVFASAQRGLLFAPLGRVSRRGVPANALVVGAVLAVLYQQSQVSRLGELFVVGAWPFYALGAIAVWRLRARGEFAQQKGAAERFVTPWFPWPQAVFALVAAMIVALYTVREPRYTAVSFAVIFAGFAFWPLFRAPPLATDESTSMKA